MLNIVNIMETNITIDLTSLKRFTNQTSQLNQPEQTLAIKTYLDYVLLRTLEFY